MKNPTWPKAFAFIGLTVMGLALAYYATTIATAGVAGKVYRTDPSGDVFSLGTAFVMVGIAMAAGYASRCQTARSCAKVTRHGSNSCRRATHGAYAGCGEPARSRRQA